jgi:P-type Ca2+ transporter type 2C
VSGLAPEASEPLWHTLSADRVLQVEKVDARRGLGSAEVMARAQRFGPNTFAAGKVESRWHAFLRQYADPMQIVLLVAGIGSLYPLKQWETGILLIFLTLFNAVLGLRQEGKAAAAVAALQKMMIVKAKVRRDGELAEIPAGSMSSSAPRSPSRSAPSRKTCPRWSPRSSPPGRRHWPRPARS